MSTPMQPKTFVDDPEVREAFADSIRTVAFSDGVWRIEFTTSRMHDARPSAPPSITVVPSCRVVLTAQAGLALLTQLGSIAAILEQQGAIKRNDPTPPPVVAPGSNGPH
jgi:hypothetical protein